MSEPDRTSEVGTASEVEAAAAVAGAVSGAAAEAAAGGVEDERGAEPQALRHSLAT